MGNVKLLAFTLHPFSLFTIHSSTIPAPLLLSALHFSEAIARNGSGFHFMLTSSKVLYLGERTGGVMDIRDAVEADWPAIIAIYNFTIACRSVTADLEPVTLESRRLWLQSHTPDKHPLWVMECQGEVAGWLGFQAFYSGRQAYYKTAELSIYVAPDYRRKGIGQKLLQTAIACSPGLGITNLVGLIFATNTASLRLFEQFGFEQWGYLPGVAEFETTACDLVIVGRKLSEQ
jgi:L-amino acid N-acyltransferase YncA